MLRFSRNKLSHFASHRYNAKLIYFDQQPNEQFVHGEDHDFLVKPKIDKKFKGRHFVDQVVDLRDKEHLELSEGIRQPREKDFYQDHTYHEEWIRRDLSHGQKKQVLQMYNHLIPGNAVNPWLWFPGDIVEVVAGPYAGQRGAVVTVLKYKNEVMVQNVNVQAVTIPATETRPEQIMQREHPIHVLKLKHVDPTTNEVCDVRLITVRDKETGKKERRRVSLASGVLLPIPKDAPLVYEGDPLHDTPLQDAEEETYDEATELPVIIERKLKALEDHFVDQLRLAHDFHRDHEAHNAADLAQYQRDVVTRAKEIIAQKLLVSAVSSSSSSTNNNNDQDQDDDVETTTTRIMMMDGGVTSSSDSILENEAFVDHILMSASATNSTPKTLRRKQQQQVVEEEDDDVEEGDDVDDVNNEERKA